MVDVGRLDNNGGIGPIVATRDGDYLLVGAHQLCVGDHSRNLTNHLNAASQKTECSGHNFVYLVGI